MMNTPHTQQPGPSRRVERSRDKRIFAGVAGGLGERFDLNPWLFRAAFIVMTLFGFAGIIFYVAGWLLIPDADEDESIAASWVSGLDVEDPAAVGGALLIGLAAVLIVSGLGMMPGRYPLAALLLIIGVLLYRGDLSLRRPGGPRNDGTGGGGIATTPAGPPTPSGTSDTAPEPPAPAHETDAGLGDAGDPEIGDSGETDSRAGDADEGGDEAGAGEGVLADTDRSSGDEGPFIGDEYEGDAGEGEAPSDDEGDGTDESAERPGQAVDKFGTAADGASTEDADTADEAPYPPAMALSAPQPAAGGVFDQPPPPVPAPADSAEPPRSRTRRQGSVLGRLTFGLALVSIGGLAAADAGNWIEPEPVHYLGTMLAVVGGALVVGAIVGRARWLVLIGALLVPPVLIASVISEIDISGDVGEQRLTLTAGDIDSEYSLAAGSLRIDLRDIELAPQEELELDLLVGAGELIIIVPRDAGLRADAAVGIGALDVLGRERAGIGLSEDIDIDGEGTFVIDAQTAVGTVEIIRR